MLAVQVPLVAKLIQVVGGDSVWASRGYKMLTNSFFHFSKRVILFAIY